MLGIPRHDERDLPTVPRALRLEPLDDAFARHLPAEREVCVGRGLCGAVTARAMVRYGFEERPDLGVEVSGLLHVGQAIDRGRRAGTRFENFLVVVHLVA